MVVAKVGIIFETTNFFKRKLLFAVVSQDFVLVTFDGLSHGTQVSHLRFEAGHVSIAVREPQVRHPAYQLADLEQTTQNLVEPSRFHCGSMGWSLRLQAAELKASGCGA